MKVLIYNKPIHDGEHKAGSIVVMDSGTIQRGPSEWGDLLWQEPWAGIIKDTKEGFLNEIFPFVVLTLMCGIGIIIGPLYNFTIEEIVVVFILFCFFLGLLIRVSLNYLHRIPHRIYEKGFTLYPSTIWFGAGKEDKFIHFFCDIKEINIKKKKYVTAQSYTIYVIYKNNAIQIENINLQRFPSFPLFLNTIRRYYPSILSN